MYVHAYVATTLKNVDLDILDFLQGTVDRKAKRAVFAAPKLAVPIETIADNLKRVASAPLTVPTCRVQLRVLRHARSGLHHWSVVFNRK